MQSKCFAAVFLTADYSEPLSTGKTIGVSVVAVLKQSGIESEPSRQVHITCPKKPPPPHVSQQPLHKHGSVLVAWDRPGGARRSVAQEGVTSYRSVRGVTKLFIENINLIATETFFWHSD